MSDIKKGPEGVNVVRGRTGPTGPTGSIGPTGPTGPGGSAGSTGATGPMNPAAISGTGTLGTIAEFTGTGSIGNSPINDTGGSIVVSSPGGLFASVGPIHAVGNVQADAALLAGTFVRIGGGAGPTWSAGSGSPEGVVTAPVGSLFSDVTGANLWFKTSGAGNTGWTQITIP
jgi:hypothetical protein